MQILKTGRCDITRALIYSPIQLRYTPMGTGEISMHVIYPEIINPFSVQMQMSADDAEEFITIYEPLMHPGAPVDITGEWKIYTNRETRKQHNYIVAQKVTLSP